MTSNLQQESRPQNRWCNELGPLEWDKPSPSNTSRFTDNALMSQTVLLSSVQSKQGLEVASEDAELHWKLSDLELSGLGSVSEDWISAGLVFTVRPERHSVQPEARDHITHSWRHFRSCFLPILHLIISAALWLFCQMININNQSSVMIITRALAIGTLLSWFLTQHWCLFVLLVADC